MANKLKDLMQGLREDDHSSFRSLIESISEKAPNSDIEVLFLVMTLVHQSVRRIQSDLYHNSGNYGMTSSQESTTTLHEVLICVLTAFESLYQDLKDHIEQI